MDNNLLTLKAESYDVMIKMDELQKEIAKLIETKNTLSAKIEALSKVQGSTKVVNEITNDTRIKQQRIIQKRLSTMPKPRNEVDEEDE